ncbi:MAG: hypothetical protein P3X22_006775 [Thermoprotei archaeon]|nr:hypothetical protein [Thermoprotei archaeon]
MYKPYWLVLAAFIVLALSTPVYSEDLRYSKVYLFDFNGDGSLEVVTNIGVIKGGALAEFARSLDVYRFNCDSGGLTCILVVDGVTGSVYSRGMLRYSLAVDGPIKVSNYPYNILSVGGRIYWGDSVYRVSLKPSGAVYGFIYGGSLASLYVDSASGYIMVDVPGSALYRVAPVAGEVIGVGHSGGLVYALLKTDVGSALVEWSPEGVFRVAPFTAKLFEAPIFSEGAFLANGEEGVYVVSRSGASLAVGGGKIVKVGVKGEVLIVKDTRLIVSRFDGSNINVITDLNLKTTVIDADYAQETLAYTDGLGVEVTSFKPPRKVELSMPRTVIAGEPVKIRVLGEFVEALIRLPDGRIVKVSRESPEVTWTPLSAGVFSVTALIDVDGESVTLTGFIEVSPRPSRLSIVAPDRVKPYSDVIVRLELYDGLTGKPRTDVIGTCILKVSGVEYPASLWTPVIVHAKPVGAEIPITASCTLPPPYYRVEGAKSVPLAETYVAVEFKYMGGGVFSVEARDTFTNKPVEGRLKAYFDRSVQELDIPGVFSLPAPGTYTLKFEFYTLEGIMLASGVQNLTWYGKVEEAPRTATLEVADVPVTVTAVQIETREVPVMVTETVRAVDPLTSLLSFFAGVALMLIPVAYLLLRARRVEAGI